MLEDRVSQDTITRRDFLIGASATAAGLWMMSKEVIAAPTGEAPSGPPVGIAMIGLGAHGRDLLTALSKNPSAKVVALCDIYEPAFKKALETATGAATFTDFNAAISAPGVEAVVVATPTHKHKDIAIAALQAGKHVYCESPLAGTIEDAKAIALAAKNSKQVFVPGLHLRSCPQHKHVKTFMEAGVPGDIAYAEAQWNKRNSWRRMAPTPERENELNWRLSQSTSTGLLGEIGIHQIDTVSWYLSAQPVSVTAMGGVLHWKDGRDVADTVSAIVEYPGDRKLTYSATLVNSFNSTHESIFGSEAAVLLRGMRAWMFKEADSPMLGWEVYARKEKVLDDTGIALVADATKILAMGKEPAKDGELEPGKDQLYYAMEQFTWAVRGTASPASSPEAGFAATVVAIKSNEALTTGNKVTFQKEWFALA